MQYNLQYIPFNEYADVKQIKLCIFNFKYYL